MKAVNMKPNESGIEANTPKMEAVYNCNPAWVQRAILHYHEKVSKFVYPPKYFDVTVYINPDGGATITANEKPGQPGIVREPFWTKIKAYFRQQVAG